jgi:hypothetical protein
MHNKYGHKKGDKPLTAVCSDLHQTDLTTLWLDLTIQATDDDDDAENPLTPNFSTYTTRHEYA